MFTSGTYLVVERSEVASYGGKFAKSKLIWSRDFGPATACEPVPAASAIVCARVVPVLKALVASFGFLVKPVAAVGEGTYLFAPTP